MAGMVYGVYNTHEEVLDAIYKLKNKGFKGKDLTVMADDRKRMRLEKKEKVNIYTLQEKEDDNAFFQMLQKVLSLGKNEDIIEKLSALGLAKDDIDVYLEQIAKGKIVLILDPKKMDDSGGKTNKRPAETPKVKPIGNSVQWSLYKNENP